CSPNCAGAGRVERSCSKIADDVVYLLQVKRPHRSVARHQHILATAYGVRLQSVVDRADMGVPERHGRPLPAQPKGNKTPGRVVGEQQTPRGCEQTGSTAVAPPCSLEATFPAELPRLASAPA